MSALGDDRWRPFFLVAIFGGLRASELRGLRWQDCGFDRRGRCEYVQRADRYNKIGRPKSAAACRTVPLPPIATNALKTWKLQAPQSKLVLVFPNGAGNVESLGNIINRGLTPAAPRRGAGGYGRARRGRPPRLRPKYGGLHALRHFHASWLINRQADGGKATHGQSRRRNA